MIKPRNMVRSRIRAAIATVILIASVPALAPAHAQQPQNWFRYGNFVPDEGRVGFHMIAYAHFFDHDVPPQCDHNAANSYDMGASVQGDLPPGITYNAQQGAFVGTPRQPGDWDLKVVFSHMHCRGSDIDFGDSTVPAHFHIAP
jgi:hypothetical protein